MSFWNNHFKVKIVNLHPVFKRMYYVYFKFKKRVFSLKDIKEIQTFDNIVLEYIYKRENYTFVQIGSNNGDLNHGFFEPVINSASLSILIEPVPQFYNDLKSKFDRIGNIFFENCAIGDENNKLIFYSVDYSKESDLPEWTKGLSSFNKSVILKHSSSVRNIESYIREISVPIISLDSLLRKYNLKKIGVLQIDTEGYDFDIIKSINFDSFKPDILIFENKHLSRKDYKSCLLLLKNVYSSIYENVEGDTICY